MKKVSTKEDHETTQKNNSRFISHLSQDDKAAFERCLQDGLAERRYVGVNVITGDYQVHYLVRL